MQELTKSLSFSSSEDSDDKAVLPIELSERILALNELFRGASYISASENTAVVSNIRRASFRDKAVKSPPLLIGDEDEREQQCKRSVFGRKEHKKYNFGQHEVKHNSSQQQHLYGFVSPLSTLDMEHNIPTP